MLRVSEATSISSPPTQKNDYTKSKRIDLIEKNLKINKMKIHLLIQEITGIGTLFRLYEKCSSLGYPVQIIWSAPHDDNETPKFIIPVDVESNVALFVKNNIDAAIYRMLDDKIDFYQWLRWNNDILGSKIRLIPEGVPGGPVKKYMIKHRRGYGSLTNNVREDVYERLLDDFPTDQYQIQEWIKVDTVLACDGFARDGRLTNVFYTMKKSVAKFQDYEKGYPLQYMNYIPRPEIEAFVINLLERISYNGFFQLEFIQDQGGQIYILECNPRISGLVFSQHYFDHILTPYLRNDFNKSRTRTHDEEGEDYFPPLWKEIIRITGVLFLQSIGLNNG
jgi:hypothetical protein